MIEKKFKVGDHVVATDMNSAHKSLIGKTGTVTTSWQNFINIYWDDRDTRNVKALDEQGWFTHRFELYYQFAPLDPNRPIRTRNGGTAIMAQYDLNLADRPFVAKVYTPKFPDGLELSFDKFGCFVPGKESPVDLVNV